MFAFAAGTVNSAVWAINTEARSHLHCYHFLMQGYRHDAEPRISKHPVCGSLLCADMASIMAYLLLRYHSDSPKNTSFHFPFSSHPRHGSCTFLIFYFHHLSKSPCLYFCVCVLCAGASENLAHPTISLSRVHFPSVRMSQMNISG